MVSQLPFVVSASKYAAQSNIILPPSTTSNIRVKIHKEETLLKTDQKEINSKDLLYLSVEV